MSDLIKYAFAKMAKHKIPSFKETKRGDFISYSTEDGKQSYPDYLVDLYNTSPKHQAIINAKNRFVMGGGWSISIDKNDLIEKGKAQQIINRANSKESLQEVTNKCDLDLRIFGGWAMEIIRTKGSNNIAEIYHIDFGKIRVFVVDEDENGNDIYKYCYLPDWKNGTIKYEKAKKEKGFREWDAFWDNAEAKSTLYYHKPHRPLKNGELDAYPIPEYVAAIGYIECDREVQNFHINNIKNNFWGGQIVKMSNVFSSEKERDDFVDDFENQKTGTDNTGSTFFVFTNSNDQQVETIPLSPSELDKQFDLLNKTIRLEVSIAHNINLKLLGNEMESQAFSRTEYNDLYEIFYSAFIKPEQNNWESIINYIYSANGFGKAFNLKAIKPISYQFSESVLTQLVPRSELQKLVAEQLNIDLSNDISQFSAHNNKSTFEQFKELGEFIDASDIITSYEVELSEDGYPIKTNEQFSKQYFAEILGADLDKFEVDVLSAVKSNPKVSIDELAQAFKVEASRISDVLTKLTGMKILVGEIGKDLRVSKKATEQISDDDVIVDIEVKYQYSGPFDSKNRDFCHDMMILSRSGKVYTRSEIDLIKNDQEGNKSAWVFRGGFYTKKGTNITTPFCRHNWKSVIIKRK